MTKKTEPKKKKPECDHYWEKVGNTLICYRCGAVQAV